MDLRRNIRFPSFRGTRILPRMVWTVVTAIVLAYSGLGTWFMVNETRLIFHPMRAMVLPPDGVPLRYERVELHAGDNVRLVGWVMRTAAGDSNRTWLLYLHGNAGNIAEWTDRYLEFQRLGVNVLAVDYRGFGESGGVPDEHGLTLDAEAMFDYLVDVEHAQPSRVVLYGHSLGTAVATELAVHRDAGCLILEGGFTSIPDRGQELYPYLPIQWIARNRFDTITKIRTLTLPKLLIHAQDDEVIPFAHGQALFAAAAPPKTFLPLRGGHNTAPFLDQDVWRTGVRQFLTSLRLLPVREVQVRAGDRGHDAGH